MFQNPVRTYDSSLTAHDLTGQFMVCPVCFNAKQLDKGDLLPNAELAGSL